MHPFDYPSSEEESRSGNVTDAIRKAVVSGLSTILANEEGIRSTIGEIPKDAFGYLSGQTEKARRELVRVVADEYKHFLQSLDLTGELKKALVGLKIEVNGSIRFVRDDGEEVQIEHSMRRRTSHERSAASTRGPRRPGGSRRRPKRNHGQQPQDKKQDSTKA